MRPIHVLALATFFISNIAIPGWAQAATPRVSQAIHVDEEPRLDGLLNDSAWSHASPTGDFIQREPHNGDAASERTEVRVVYTGRTLFIGGRLYDRQASRITATTY